MAEVASAYVSLLPSAKGFGRKLDQQVGGDLDRSGKQGGRRFGAAFKGVLGPALAVAGSAAVAGLLKGSIDEAREAQKVGAQTRQVIKTTGGAAKVSAKQIGDLATSISLKTGMDDEAIQSGANLLLTFKNVKREGSGLNDVFGRATQAAADLSAAGFGDLNGASKQLGKALNDPLKGMTALGRSGVTFSESQKAQIKALVKNNDLLGAQKIILKEVESQVGGSAQAQATAGEKMSVAFGNLKEQIGTALLPVIDRLASTMTTKVVPALSSAIKYLQANPAIIYAFGAAIGALAVAFVALFVAANWIPITFAAIVAGLVYAYVHFETFRNIVNTTFTAIKAIITAAMPYVTAIIRNALTVLTGIFRFWKSVFTGDWRGAWAAVKQIVTGALATVRSVISAQLAAVRGIFRAVGPAILGIVRSAFGALKGAAASGIGKLLGSLKELPGKIKGAVGDLSGVLVDAGKAIIGGLIRGITAKMGDLGSKLKGVGDFVKAHKGPPSYDKVMLTPAGRQIMDGLIGGIDSGLPALGSKLAQVNSQLTASVAVPSGARLHPGSSGAAAGRGGDRPVVMNGSIVGVLRNEAELVFSEQSAFSSTLDRMSA